MAEVYKRFLKGRVGHDHAVWKIRRRRPQRIDELAAVTKRIEALLHRRRLQLRVLRKRIDHLEARVHDSWVMTVLRQLALGDAALPLREAWQRGLIVSPKIEESMVTYLLAARRRFDGAHRRLDLAGEVVLERGRHRLETAAQGLHGQWRRFTMDLAEEVGRIVRQDAPSVEFSLELDTCDTLLIDFWRRSGSEEELDRLTSARHAEKAAGAYYRQLGRTVEDVSALQLDDTRSDDSGWQTHDLLVDDKPVDVKNVRFARGGTLSEHLWQDHKVARGGQPVAIAGVASEEVLDGVDARKAIVLGELSKRALDEVVELAEAASRQLGVVLQPSAAPDWSHKVPGWLYEYPEVHYVRTRPIIERLVSGWARVSRMGFGTDGGPSLDGIGVSIGEPVGTGGRRQDELLASMASWFAHLPVSRPSVFLFVLLYMLSAARAGTDNPGTRLSQYLFLPKDDDHRKRPLGLHDEQQYVSRLIRALDEVIERRRDVLRDVKFYRLRGPNVLQGLISGRWCTVLSYCHCGTWPLLLGECATCECSLARLRCPVCERCNLACYGREQHFDNREEAVAKAVSSGWVVRRHPSHGWVAAPRKPGARTDLEVP